MTTILGVFAGGMVLARTNTASAPILVAYMGALAAVIILVFELRVPLTEFYRDLHGGEKLGLGILCGILFLGPSFARGGWAPLTGLALLFFPLALGLVYPPGFARFYMLAGISVALATAHLSPDRALPILLAFVILLVICCVLEAWFFSLMSRDRRAPGTRRPMVRRNDILALACSRLLLATLITLPIACILSTLRLESVSLRPRPDRPLPRLAESLEMDLSLLQFLVQSVVIMVGAICLALLYRWLESRRPRTSGDGEPFGTAFIENMEMADSPPIRKSRPPEKLNPRESILAMFERLSERLTRWDLHRLPQQTPSQWHDQPGTQSATPPSPPDGSAPAPPPTWPVEEAQQLADQIARMATKARYDPAQPDWDEVREFDRTCTRLLKVLRKSARV